MGSRDDERNRKALARMGLRLDHYRDVAIDAVAALVVSQNDPGFFEMLDAEDREAARSRAQDLASRMRGRTG